MNPLALEIIKKFEGCRLKAYQDAGGVWTCGYGATGPDVKHGTVWTQDQADDRLLKDVQKFQEGVEALVTVYCNDNQMAAIISLAYNIGLGNFKTSSLLRKLNAENYAGCADEFLKWNRVNGKLDKGVLSRRKEERTLFLSEVNHLI